MGAPPPPLRVLSVKRISLVGSSGSVKTTVARRLAKALSVPHIEVDALHWGANWNAATKDELLVRVKAATTGEAWVVDETYWSKLGPQVWTMADHPQLHLPQQRFRRQHPTRRRGRRAAARCCASRAGSFEPLPRRQAEVEDGEGL